MDMSVRGRDGRESLAASWLISFLERHWMGLALACLLGAGVMQGASRVCSTYVAAAWARLAQPVQVHPASYTAWASACGPRKCVVPGLNLVQPEAGVLGGDAFWPMMVKPMMHPSGVVCES